jgi:hypothetical protein
MFSCDDISVINDIKLISNPTFGTAPLNKTNGDTKNAMQTSFISEVACFNIGSNLDSA